MKILYAILGAYLLYQLQKYLYKKYWNKQLMVNISLSEDHAIEGEDRILTETITNRKLLPIPILKVKFMTSKYLEFYDMSNSVITDNYYRADLLSVMMFQKISRTISFRCSHRGYYTINKAHLVCSDLLLESEFVSVYDLNVHLYVYPRPVARELLQIPFKNMLGSILSKRLINEDPFEFKSIREYQSYDSFKQINWKASAKVSSLMVNVYDYTASPQFRILMNMETPVLGWQTELFEESIRIAATLAEMFLEQGVPASLDTNATDIITKEPILLPAGSGINHIRSINEALARIDSTVDSPVILSHLKEELSDSKHNDFIVLISTYQKEDLQGLLSSLLHNNIDFIWILPYCREVAVNIDAGLRPHVFEWEYTGSY